MKATIGFEGKDLEFASNEDILAGAAAARDVFDRQQANPVACARSSEKRHSNQLLSKEDAINCVVWDEANYAAWHAMTHGWLRRDVDIHLSLITPDG